MKDIKKFLRYGSRHSIYFPRGFEGRTFPQLNPICSSSHGADHKRTWRIYEHLWMFLTRRRVFGFAGAQRCPDRGEFNQYRQRDGKESRTPDSWNYMPNGERTCSYCGSLHPEDMMMLVRRCIETNAEDVRIEPTGKSYKCYVWQKGVVNASQGAIKFYMQHVIPEMITVERQAEYSKAVRITDETYRRQCDERAARIAENFKK